MSKLHGRQLFGLKGHQQGQSTIEMIVISLFLVPLMLIAPLLGKYLDIAETTTVASRYVAFEGSVHHSSSLGGWKSDAALTKEVQRRFYSNVDAPIKTNDVAGNFNADRNALWFDHRGDALLPDFDKNVIIGTKKDTLAQPFGALYAGEFDLPRNNLYTGRVNVNIANIAGLAPFDTLGLSVDRHATLLVDPWAASGPGEVKSKVHGAGWLYPYQALDALATIMTPIITIFEFGAPPPKIGRVDPDWVPKDRVLQPYK
jgi:hypothetical protein